MIAGTMRHEITIQALANSSTELTSRGQISSPSWGKLATVRASIEPLAGQEFLNARQLYPTVTHRIRTRYVAGVTQKARAVYGSRTFNFQQVINVDERSRELEILAGEEV